jgi:hypothetical protein
MPEVTALKAEPQVAVTAATDIHSIKNPRRPKQNKAIASRLAPTVNRAQPQNYSDRQTAIAGKPAPTVNRAQPQNHGDRQTAITGKPAPTVNRAQPQNYSDRQTAIAGKPAPTVNRAQPQNYSDRLAALHRGDVPAGSNVLFVMTGGLPGVFAYRSAFD